MKICQKKSWLKSPQLEIRGNFFFLQKFWRKKSLSKSPQLENQRHIFFEKEKKNFEKKK